jgi:hypothetical protein
VPLLGVEGMVEGSVGAGAAAMAEIGFSGSRFVWHTKANLTWGVGVGASVKITLDMVEGIKYALLVLGELREPAVNYATQKIKEGLSSIGDALDGFLSWLSSDDKVREMVAKHAHLVVGPDERATMLDTLMGGTLSYCGPDDEDAIVKILQHSYSNGDLAAVIAAGGGAEFKSRIVSKVDDDAASVIAVKGLLGS